MTKGSNVPLSVEWTLREVEINTLPSSIFKALRSNLYSTYPI